MRTTIFGSGHCYSKYYNNKIRCAQITSDSLHHSPPVELRPVIQTLERARNSVLTSVSFGLHKKQHRCSSRPQQPHATQTRSMMTTMMMTTVMMKYFFTLLIQSGKTDSSSALTKMLLVFGTCDGVKFPAE